MAVAPSVRTKQTTIDNVSWTAIVAPVDCNTCVVRNVNGSAVVLKFRTDDTDATTEFSINPNMEYSFGGPFTPPHNYGGRFRFLAGQTVVYVQLASGSYGVAQTFF